MTKDEVLKQVLFFLEKMESHSWRARDIYNLRDDISEALKESMQEPVGWAEDGVINWLADKQFNHTSFLYDTPPQRKWVGLTKEEFIYFSSYCHSDVVDEIEKLLQRKNT